MDRPPPVLRTGLLGGEGPTIDKNSPLGKRLLGLVFVLVKRAATTAAMYCAHDARSMVTPDDVRLALKYHAMTFFSEAGYDQLERDVNDMEGMVDAFVTESLASGDIVDAFADDAVAHEASSDEETSTDDDVDPETPADPGCDCEVCRGIRELEWDAWNPTDPAERFIKSHIEDIESM